MRPSQIFPITLNSYFFFAIRSRNGPQIFSSMNTSHASTGKVILHDFSRPRQFDVYADLSGRWESFPRFFYYLLDCRIPSPSRRTLTWSGINSRFPFFQIDPEGTNSRQRCAGPFVDHSDVSSVRIVRRSQSGRSEVDLIY